MSAAWRGRGQAGFTLLELLIAMAVFLVVCGAMFGLLELSQKNYGRETQLSGSFQEARLATDQIVRDFDQSGYPALGLFSNTPGNPSTYAFSPVAWSPNYPATPCITGTGGGGTCSTPGDFDLIVETSVGNGVNWIRYQLVGSTLYRAVVPKSGGTDPAAATSAPGVMVPFLVNVMNNPSAGDLAEITATYPTMFPGGQPVPIFQYSCDTGTGTIACPNAGTSNAPANIRDVDVTLIVRTPSRDLQTQRWKLVELNGRGHRLNPSN